MEQPTWTAVMPLIVIALALVANYYVQRGTSNRYDYRCQACDRLFSLSPLAGAVAPHRLGGRKWARCPNCGTFSWVSRVPKS